MGWRKGVEEGGVGVQQRNQREEQKETKDPSLSEYGTNMFDTHTHTHINTSPRHPSGREPSSFLDTFY